MDMPHNETPEAVSSVFSSLLSFISSYGWHLLFLVVTANLLWSHIKPKVQKWQEKKQNEQLESQYAQNPARLIELQEGLERSRQRLQEEHERRAREYAEKKKQMEEEKRLEKIKKWESVQKGTSLKPESSPEQSADESQVNRPPRGRGERLRPQEYNPLMGAGGGTYFRPSRDRGGRAGG